MQVVDATPSGFWCENLPPEQAGTVFPLLREAIPGLTLPAWLRHVKRLGGQRRAGPAGVMAVWRHPRPMPCGLFVYRRVEDLEHGAVLVAEHIVAIDLLDPAPVMRVLVAELEALAKRLGCSGVRTVVLGGESPIARQLQAAGHARNGAALWKPLDGAAPGRRPPARRRDVPGAC